MNKFFLFAIATMFSLTACGNTTNKSNAESVNSTASVEAKDTHAVKHLNKAEFLAKVYNYEKNPNEWIFEGDKPAIVDFYATWCGPCKAIAPVLEELANEYKGKIDIYKIDTDKEKELARAFGIRSIPTLLFIPAKGDPQISQGALPKAELKKAIEEFLLGNKK